MVGSEEESIGWLADGDSNPDRMEEYFLLTLHTTKRGLANVLDQ